MPLPPTPVEPPLPLADSTPSPWPVVTDARALTTLIPVPPVTASRPIEVSRPPVTVTWAESSISTLPPPLMAATPTLVALPVGAPTAPTSSTRMVPVPTVTLTAPAPT